MIAVTHAVPSLGQSGGGPPRSVSQLCGALCEQGQAIRIVTAVDPADPIVPLSTRIQLTQLEGRGNSFMDRLRAANFGGALARIHQKNPITLIHQHGIWLRSSHAVTSYAHENQLPLVVAPRGMLEPWAINNSKWKKKLAWMLYQKRDLQRATAFHATAHLEAESIRRLGFKQPIAVIPNGIQLPEHRQSSAITHPSSTKTALFLSRINPKKGLLMLLDAWKQLAPEGWRLVIAGNDDSNHLPVVQAKIAEHGLQEQVEVVGPLFATDKETAYRNADLFVLPSYSENFGIVIAEALGYNVPVLTTTGCPWQELETHGCGWWVEPATEAIQTGLNAAFGTQSEELAAMGCRGRRLVEEKYQWPGIAERMLKFYDWLSDGGIKPEFVV